MIRPVFKLYEGSLQERYLNSKAKIQMMGGGFANGKTTSTVIKTLRVAKDYHGANILMARSTYPKLNDTLRKEFLKWCPTEWIKRKALSENIVELKNGTTINFRYIQQQGKSNGESSTSNLLSATYDLIVVDQIEDPEIEAKDFDDLLGRLRGNAVYHGDDPTMPETGPRWMFLTTNPTANWVYKKLVRPLHEFNKGKIVPELLVEVGDDGVTPVLKDGKPIPLMELFEGSTYENKENIPKDFLKTLEATYKGQMRDRFLLGKWAAYEGLIYQEYDSNIHQVPHQQMVDYYYELVRDGYKPTIVESYDHGMAEPACYLFAFVDPYGNVCVLDGFYEKERSIDWLVKHGIKTIRRTYNQQTHGDGSQDILADPDIFRRKTGNSQTVGISVAGIFSDEYGIKMIRGNNDIEGGIAKVQSYINLQEFHRNPFTGNIGAPYIYFSDKLDFIDNEIVDYFWEKNTYGEWIDKPRDKNDHSLDSLKYLLTRRPRIAQLMLATRQVPRYMMWSEVERQGNAKRHRYG
jgi:hypothetical protein